MMKFHSLVVNRALIGIAAAFAALVICGCGGASQESTYSVVSQKMVGAADAPPAASPGTPPSDLGSQASASAAETKQNNLVGVWEGSTRASCQAAMPFQDRCNAVQEVKMTLLRNDNGNLVGHYQCSYGNMDCFHMNETGRIVDASLNGPQVTMRVMLPDGTSCTYTGRTTPGNDVDGGYSCYSGGAMLEQGSWHAKRTF